MLNPLRHSDFAYLEEVAGIHLPEVHDYIEPQYRRNFQLAMDAQPALVTVSNAGIPAYLANYIDPTLIEVLVAPNRASQVAEEVKKGDWTTITATFPVIEHTGEVSTYGDWNENGSSGINPTFPVRQSYYYQTMTQWGERQLAMAGLAKIDWASQVNTSSVEVLNKFQNQSYFFGIGGLMCYGLLNDPQLPAALTPAAKQAGGNKWVTNGVVTATANEVYTDIQSLYLQVVVQNKGLIDAQTPIILAMSPQSDMALTATNNFNVSVRDLLRKNFPNIEFVVAAEYSTAAGELVQLWVKEIERQKTAITAFTEKLRTHPVIRGPSNFMQKKSQGTWGAIIFAPYGVSQMIGV